MVLKGLKEYTSKYRLNYFHTVSFMIWLFFLTLIFKGIEQGLTSPDKIDTTILSATEMLFMKADVLNMSFLFFIVFFIVLFGCMYHLSHMFRKAD